VWSYTPGSAFTQAAHTLTAKATDAAGNVSTASTGLTLTPGSTGLTTDATALSAAQTIRGSSASDTLKGGAGNDTLTGGAGSDALTGAAGNDTFVYTNATDSLVSGFDTISDFSATNMGTDVLKIGKTVTTANFKTASQAGTSSGLSADLRSALQALSFGQSCAALVTLTGAADAGSYVVINNHSTKAITTNGFLASSDTVIKVQTGATVTAASFIV
jgi:Ca2+-binding RTX toxin-like protein